MFLPGMDKIGDQIAMFTNEMTEKLGNIERFLAALVVLTTAPQAQDVPDSFLPVIKAAWDVVERQEDTK